MPIERWGEKTSPRATRPSAVPAILLDRHDSEHAAGAQCLP
jgi:hypothetical protein